MPRPPLTPGERRVNMTIAMSRSQHQALRAEAARLDLSVGAIIRAAIRDTLPRLKKRKAL